MSFAFNPDGSLKAAPKKKKDHTPLLLALEEVPFGMGKKLLITHLQGKENARTIKLRLDRYMTFGELGGYQEQELEKLIDYLDMQGLIAIRREKGRYPVYTLTEKGSAELENPQLDLDINDLERAASKAFELKNPFPETTPLTEQEQQLTKALHDFFPHFNDEQRQAVIDSHKHILCVAGAGSGKTSVLTKRIAFLTTYKGVPANKILAITFTRKARREMQERLAKQLPGKEVHIETFNSLAEKLLQRFGSKLYNAQVSMIGFREKFQLILETLNAHHYSQSSIVNYYFTQRQRAGKDAKTLFFTFAYDFQSLVDKIRLTNTSANELKAGIKSNQEHAPLAHLLLDMADHYLKLMQEQGYRDYTDQLLDTIKLFETQSGTIPRYEHVLVDEYQDVNDHQIRLLELLNAPNQFCVGDPRQSIYGWRGSRISHILGYHERHEGTNVIQLTKNYRSAKPIVDFCNDVIKKTGYPDLEAGTARADGGQAAVNMHYHASEDQQASSVIQAIKNYQGDRKEIFVLARTNKALEKIQQGCDAHQLPYLLRTDELKRPGVEARSGQVTLATVHAIKGLEANEVHLIQANSTSFPCKASDHPVMELFDTNNDYDAYAEELRVLYVALSRAKDKLHINYTGSLTPFIPEDLKASITKTKQKTLKKKQPLIDEAAATMKLRSWRYNQAKEQGCPAYVIFPDSTLEALIEERPTTIEALKLITGMGRARIETYGEQLLSFLQGLA